MSKRPKDGFVFVIGVHQNRTPQGARSRQPSSIYLKETLKATICNISGQSSQISDKSNPLMRLLDLLKGHNYKRNPHDMSVHKAIWPHKLTCIFFIIFFSFSISLPQTCTLFKSYSDLC